MTHYTKGTPSQDWTLMTIRKVEYAGYFASGTLMRKAAVSMPGLVR